MSFAFRSDWDEMFTGGPTSELCEALNLVEPSGAARRQAMLRLSCCALATSCYFRYIPSTLAGQVNR